MAKPMLDIVPSYDVTKGVTLTFNANYGTNLVRGSQLTIYDKDQNVVARHLYVPSTYNEASTIHKIPSKQALINESITPSTYSASVSYSVDAVVAYEDATYICIAPTTGNAPTNTTYWERILPVKWKASYISNDFATKYDNQKQLQFSLMTFVSCEIDPIKGDFILSGLSEDSNTRGALTLPIPTVTFDKIDSTISTTSYTIGLTYDTNQTTSVGLVYNPPKVVQFDLYDVDNDVLIKSSGEVYNSGTMIYDTEYYMNYTFSGLVNGNTYKVVATITSLLNMEVSGKSTDFLVNATTYQISTFNVENDSCNGRVKVISNILDVYGESNRTPVDGKIDLTNGGYCTWTDGLGFTNNWTARIWGYDFEVADTIPSDQHIIHMASTQARGVIDGYIVKDPNGYRFDLYVYPIGYDGVTMYFQSNVVSTLGTSAHPLCIAFGFDYNNSGSYFVKIV